MCMEPPVFNIAIKGNKQKYGATSTVVMTKRSNVLLYHGKYPCNNQIANLVQFIDTCFYKEKKCPILFSKLVYCFVNYTCIGINTKRLNFSLDHFFFQFHHSGGLLPSSLSWNYHSFRYVFGVHPDGFPSSAYQ
jgi:hypothetical protein